MFFQHLFELVHDAHIAFIVVLAALAVLAIIPMTWYEIIQYRRHMKHAKLVEDNAGHSSMDTVYIASRPMTANIGIKMARPFRGRRKLLVRWCVTYATSPAAVFVLSLAIAGFFSCMCQYILLHGVRSQFPEISQGVGDFAGEIVNRLQNVSEQWAINANAQIKDVNDEDALKTVVHCVISIKVESVEKGLIWAHDHAHVELPLFDKNIFSLGANKPVGGDSELKTFLASPSSLTTDELSGAVKRVTGWLHTNLVQETLISTGILLVYVIIVLIGVMGMLSRMAMPTDRHSGRTDRDSNGMASTNNYGRGAGADLG